jgi:type IV pilus assembly protein PilV
MIRTASTSPLSMPYLSQRGFTLVEVLAAIFILALAASGVAAMQLHALRTAQHSAYQSAALQLAIELAEMLRADIQPAPEQFEYESIATQPVACARTDCDLAAWKQRLADALPRARVVVCTDSAPVRNETLRWSCNGAGGPLLIKIGWASREREPAATVQSEPPPFLALPVER